MLKLLPDYWIIFHTLCRLIRFEYWMGCLIDWLCWFMPLFPVLISIDNTSRKKCLYLFFSFVFQDCEIIAAKYDMKRYTKSSPGASEPDSSGAASSRGDQPQPSTSRDQPPPPLPVQRPPRVRPSGSSEEPILHSGEEAMPSHSDTSREAKVRDWRSIPSYRSIDWSFVRSTHWLIDWLIDWLFNGVSDKSMNLFYNLACSGKETEYYIGLDGCVAAENVEACYDDPAGWFQTQSGKH